MGEKTKLQKCSDASHTGDRQGQAQTQICPVPSSPPFRCSPHSQTPEILLPPASLKTQNQVVWPVTRVRQGDAQVGRHVQFSLQWNWNDEKKADEWNFERRGKRNSEMKAVGQQSPLHARQTQRSSAHGRTVKGGQGGGATMSEGRGAQRCQILYGLTHHGRGVGFYSEGNGKLLEGFRLGSDMIWFFFNTLQLAV